MSPAERAALMDRYDGGVALLKAALGEVPAEARQWRPAPDKWTVHEVVCHCADSETNSAMRIRYLVGEPSPTIVGYDQDGWARVFDYHRQSLDLALAQLDAVRRWTGAFIRTLPDSAWSRSGRHTEVPDQPYTAESWLMIYAEHLEIHARQIRRNLEAYHASGR